MQADKQSSLAEIQTLSNQLEQQIAFFKTVQQELKSKEVELENGFEASV